LIATNGLQTGLPLALPEVESTAVVIPAENALTAIHPA
jgi:hypothetical protein